MESASGMTMITDDDDDDSDDDNGNNETQVHDQRWMMKN